MVVQQPFHSAGIIVRKNPTRKTLPEKTLPEKTLPEKTLPENDLNPAVRYMLLWTCTPDWFCDQTHAESPCNELRKRNETESERNGSTTLETKCASTRRELWSELPLFPLSNYSLSLSRTILSLSNYSLSLELFSLSLSLELFSLSLLFELESRGMSQDFDHSLKSAGHRTHTVRKWMWKGKNKERTDYERTGKGRQWERWKCSFVLPLYSPLSCGWWILFPNLSFSFFH